MQSPITALHRKGIIINLGLYCILNSLKHVTSMDFFVDSYNSTKGSKLYFSAYNGSILFEPTPYNRLLSTSVFEDNNTSSSLGEQETEIEWLKIFDQCQLVMTITGVFANFLTFLTLSINGKAFSPMMLILLRHQSIVDSVVCLMASIYLLQPFMWVPGHYILDLIMCIWWNGQGTFWAVIYLSIWNLVILAYERYLAVCRPFYHNQLTSRKIGILISMTYLTGWIYAVAGSYQVRLSNGKCTPEYRTDSPLLESFFFAYGIFSFVTYYVLPCAFFFVFYGLVLIGFQKRRNSEMASSRIIDKATSELTKTAITVTAIFIISMGFEFWYYMLGYTEVVSYTINSPIQQVALWMTSLNSVANPFVYGLLLPAYRKSLVTTFCCRSRLKSGKK